MLGERRSKHRPCDVGVAPGDRGVEPRLDLHVSDGVVIFRDELRGVSGSESSESQTDVRVKSPVCKDVRDPSPREGTLERGDRGGYERPGGVGAP